MTRLKCLITACAALALVACSPGNSSNDEHQQTSTNTALPDTAPFLTEEFDAQYGLGIIKAQYAYARGAFGAEVLVGLLDSGIDTDHIEFSGRLHAASTDVVVDGRPFEDYGNHGSIVGGTIFSARDGDGTHGVAPEAEFIIYSGWPPGCTQPGGRNCANFPNEGIVRAVDHAIEHDVRVINMSFGWPEPDSADSEAAVRAAFHRASDADVVIVIASGNNNFDAPIFPAYLAGEDGLTDTMMIVGAIGPDLKIADFTNRAGSAMNGYVVAPGVEIVGPSNDGGYRDETGTSLAAPHASGAIALLLGHFPDMTGQEAVSILRSSATDLGLADVDRTYGYGLINLQAAFELAEQSR